MDAAMETIAPAETPSGDLLGRICGPEISLVEVERIPGSRPGALHLALAPAGVWAIAIPRPAERAEVLRPLRGDPRLLIGGNDGSRMIRGLLRSLGHLHAAVSAYDPDLAVLGAVCLPETSLPRFRSVSIAGCPLLSPTALAREMERPGPLETFRHGQLEWELVRTFGGV